MLTLTAIPYSKLEEHQVHSRKHYPNELVTKSVNPLELGYQLNLWDLRVPRMPYSMIIPRIHNLGPSRGLLSILSSYDRSSCLFSTSRISTTPIFPFSLKFILGCFLSIPSLLRSSTYHLRRKERNTT